MSDIFLSYAREDLERAQAFAEAFEEHGWSTFWDRRTPPGKTWPQVLEAELIGAGCVVVLWSKASIKSRWIREEADEALARDILVPVRIGSVSPPFGFRSLQAAELPDWQGEAHHPDFQQLLEAVSSLLGSKHARGVDTKPRRETDDSGRIDGVGAIFRDQLRDGLEGPEMVVVPAGSFMMGSPDSDKEAEDEEKPQHRVEIPKPIAVGRYPVTFEEYDHFAEATNLESPADEKWGRGRRPVIHVDWDDAQAYVAWLAEQTGKTYRLLSEAEWEYAARAGTRTRYSCGDNISEEDANFGGNVGKTSEVGSYPANAWKLHDMHGNVWEWVEDCWNDSYEGAPTDGSAWKSGDCEHRVLRGGSWVYIPGDLRSADRSWDEPGNRSRVAGFRVARTLP